MHLHLAFGDFVLIDMRLNSSLFVRPEPELEPDLDEEAADSGLYL